MKEEKMQGLECIEGLALFYTPMIEIFIKAVEATFFVVCIKAVIMAIAATGYGLFRIITGLLKTL